MISPALLAVYLLMLAAKVALARSYARAYPRPARRTDFSDATILQPILGGDPTLADALAANVGRLPGARFVWLLDADDAAGWTAARAVRERFSAAAISLRETPPAPPRTNPKLHKLAHAEAAVDSRFFIVLDDDTRLTAHGAAALLDGLRAADLCTGLPHYLPGKNAPSRLVAQFVNDHGALTYLSLLRWMQPVTINGMAYALETARWRALGGFAPLANRLTDDLAVATCVRRAGGRIRQTCFPHETATTVRDWRQYAALMHRWLVFAALLARQQPPARQFLIAAWHAAPSFLWWIALVWFFFAPSVAGGTAVLIAALARAALIASAHRLHFGRHAGSLALSFLAELLLPWHLAHALASRRIRWRTRTIVVRADDDFSYV